MFCWKKLKLSRYLPGPTLATREQDVDLRDGLNGPTVCDSDRIDGLGKAAPWLSSCRPADEVVQKGPSLTKPNFPGIFYFL